MSLYQYSVQSLSDTQKRIQSCDVVEVYLQHKISPTKMDRWYGKVIALGNNNFRSVIKTFKNHAPTILNYFHRSATNASAEAFNSKVKIFRAHMRGVRDRNFFIFQLVKLYA